MAIGFGLLRLSPKDFWTMTPRELAAAGGLAAAGADAPSRDELAALAGRFPDRRT